MAYDTGYDDGSRSLTAVSCSDGQNGLITRYGWQTQGQIPKFPYIGAAAAVEGWNSKNCGTCWAITYPKTGKTVNVLVVDSSKDGFVLSLTALNVLTKGQGVALGRVDANVVQVNKTACGV